MSKNIGTWSLSSPFAKYFSQTLEELQEELQIFNKNIEGMGGAIKQPNGDFIIYAAFCPECHTIYTTVDNLYGHSRVLTTGCENCYNKDGLQYIYHWGQVPKEFEPLACPEPKPEPPSEPFKLEIIEI